VTYTEQEIIVKNWRITVSINYGNWQEKKVRRYTLNKKQ